jgi:hypothetical protein
VELRSVYYAIQAEGRTREAAEAGSGLIAPAGWQQVATTRAEMARDEGGHDRTEILLPKRNREMTRDTPRPCAGAFNPKVAGSIPAGPSTETLSTTRISREKLGAPRCREAAGVTIWVNTRVGLRRTFEQAGVTKDKTAIVYCTIGNRASQAWFALKYLLDYPDVRVYYGSWVEWGRAADAPIDP